MPLLLKKSLYGKTEEIERALEECESNENILYFNNCDELYDSYYSNIIPENVLVDNLQSYNEIYNTKDSLFIFFMDIDIEKDENEVSNTEEEISDTEDVNFKQNNIHELLAFTIQKFIKYLLKRNEQDIIIQEIKDKELFSINKKTRKEILEQVYVTKNKNENKYSFHVYFPKLVINESCIPVIKNIVKSFKIIYKNKISKNIDDHVYKKNLSLRLLYCKKNKDDVYYHYPIYCEYTDNDLEIIDEEIELTKKSFRNYLFTFDNRKNNYYIVEEYVPESEKKIDIVLDMEKLNLSETSLTNPYHYFLTYNKIFTMVFSLVNQTEFEFKKNLKNIEVFSSHKKITDKDEKIVLEFDYTKYKCIFCNKKHKRVHVVHIGNKGINIIKEGRCYNCKIKSIPFRGLDELEICEFIYSKDLVKKLYNDEIIVFNENDGWCLAKNKQNNYSSLKKLLLDNKKYFIDRDKKLIHKMSELKLKENFNSLLCNKDVVDTYYPYLFKFANGIYDIKNETFIEMKDSKHIYIVNGVNYNFVDEKDYSEQQKYDRDYLQTVIDQIMPEVIDGEINKNRIIFETNLSSSILMYRKNVITIFQGETSAGKTTIKNLIISTLGNNNYIDLPISTYTSHLDPNKPNPWLGSIENKRVSFASESYYVDKLNTQTVKLLTEVKILCRNMYSSDVGQKNILSQFIDTNHTLSLDNPDAASYKRLAVIKFNSHFKNKDNGNFFIPMKNSLVKNNFEEKNNLSEDILSDKYALIFFNILKNWVLKYHKEKIVLKNTSELTDYCILNTIIIQTTFVGYGFNVKYIKDSAKHEYKIIKLQSNLNVEIETIACSTVYFKKYYNQIIKKKNLDIDINILIVKLKFERKNKSFIPFVILDDIKEDILEKVVEEYNNKKIPEINKENINLKYYYENKKDFENKDSSDNEDEDEYDETEEDGISFNMDNIFEQINN